MMKLRAFKKLFVPNYFYGSLKRNVVHDAKIISRVKLCNKDNKSSRLNLLYAIGGSVSIVTVLGILHQYRNFWNDYKLFSLSKLFSVKAAEKQSLRSSFNFLADVVEKTSKSVVYIEITARYSVLGKTVPISNGSGFVVNSDGLILTNAHVVNHFGYVNVKLHDGREFSGVVEDIDSESDLATVRIQTHDLPVLPLGKSSTLRPGEFVIAMGNPLTLSHTVTAGVVSSVSRHGRELGMHKKSDYIQTDAAINVGNSGGPLVNLDGEVIGINTMKVTEGISFAIPSDRATEFLKQAETKQKGKWNILGKTPEKKKHKFLGITMMTLTPVVIKDLKERNPEFPPVDHGVLVWRVMVGSPSYENGIRPGDVVTQVNGQNVYSAIDIQKLLEKEDVLDIIVLRSDKKIKCKVPLVETVMP